MPVIRYGCLGCGKEFAKIFFGEDDAPKLCPVCGGPQLIPLGPAFKPDFMAAERLSCVSCEGCGDGPVVSVSGSS